MPLAKKGPREPGTLFASPRRRRRSRDYLSKLADDFNRAALARWPQRRGRIPSGGVSIGSSAGRRRAKEFREICVAEQESARSAVNRKRAP